MRITTKDVRNIEHTEQKEDKTLIYGFTINKGQVVDLRCEVRGKDGAFGFFKYKDRMPLPDTTFVNMPASGELQTHIAQQFNEILNEFQTTSE